MELGYGIGTVALIIGNFYLLHTRPSTSSVRQVINANVGLGSDLRVISVLFYKKKTVVSLSNRFITKIGHLFIYLRLYFNVFYLFIEMLVPQCLC